jgi:hypothetical protein
VKRAAQRFAIEEAALDSAYVEKVWRAWSEPGEGFISVAAGHWELVVTHRDDGAAYLTVRGPETKATVLPVSRHAEFCGIQFRAGAFMPDLPPSRLVDAALTLPRATGRCFWLQGAAWDFPDFGNADVFVARLVREGLLVRDPLVAGVLGGQLGDATGLSARSVQRRVVRATGLTRGAIRQIERAERPVALLDRGAAILDVGAQAGYADQAHMTRALKRFVGQTPGEIVRGRRSISA